MIEAAEVTPGDRVLEVGTGSGYAAAVLSRIAAAVPVVGFLSGRSQEESAGDAAAFRQGLNEMGYVAGRNVALEYRWAEGRNERLPELAADLVRRGSRSGNG
jgi:putative ABC transport system substrate-binding protein